jgi:uncharacterized protein
LALRVCAWKYKGRRRRCISALKFIVDENVGKLTRWLRMMGFDSIFFTGGDDSMMVKQALAGGRVLLTRDTGIMQRRVVKSGALKAVLFKSEEPEQQMRRLIGEFELIREARPFTLCLECNQPLDEKNPEEIKDRVPPYVFATQTRYMECPRCRRVYWQGSHWQAMNKKLEELSRRECDAGI